MDQTWERTTPHAHLSKQQIDEWVGSALPSETVVAAQLIEHGRANTNYRVLLQSGRTVLLRYHVRDPHGAIRETKLYDLVRPVVPVPQVIAVAPDGRWSIQEWIDAPNMSEVLDRGLPVDPFSVGCILAGLSQFAFDEAGFFDDDLRLQRGFGRRVQFYKSHIDELACSDMVQARVGAELLEACRSWLDSDWRMVEEVESTVCLVHADYKPSNLLIRDGKVVAVLDWEFAHSGSPLLDIAILMRDERLSDATFSREFRKAFVASGGVLPKCWLRAAHLLDLISLFEFIGHPDAGPQLLCGCRSIIERYLAQRSSDD